MAVTRNNKSEAEVLPLAGRRVGIALALVVPLASAAYAAPPPAGDAGTGPAAARGTAARAKVAQRPAPVPLEDNGVAPIPGSGAPNVARPPDAPTPAAPGVPPNPYANYRIKGIVVNLPQPSNTVDLQLGGYRQKLADDYGIGYFGLSQTAFNFTPNIYDKFGVARAITPDGTVLGHNYNPTGILKFYTLNSGPLFINELGYLRPAAIGVPQTWVRGGAFLDKSRFPELDHPGRRSNNQYALYLLGDRQSPQISSAPGEAYRGWYAGFSAEYTPANYNRFSQYYEARLYGLGIIPGRPFDQATAVFTENVFSNVSYRAARRAGLPAHSDSKALTLSYSV